MEIVKTLVHWSGYVYYLYVFGYAALFKVFQKQSMIEAMQSFGFNKTWTIIIGTGELLGVILLVAGLCKNEFKNLGILLLFPFAVGAFTTHMAYQDYTDFYDSLMMCVISIVLLITDKHFRIIYK